MNRLDALRASYTRYVSLPWDRSLPGQQRVWFAVYDPADERTVVAVTGVASLFGFMKVARLMELVQNEAHRADRGR